MATPPTPPRVPGRPPLPPLPTTPPSPAPALPPRSQELLEKGLLPVKRDSIRGECPSRPGPRHSKPRPGGLGGQPAPLAPSPGAVQKRVYAGAVQSGTGAAPAEPVQRKSKNQMKRERREAMGQCSRFLQGTCEFGDKCKFRHDAEGYLAGKPDDLPGPCPFERARDTCPYGIACRWASAHAAVPPQFAEAFRADAARRAAARAGAEGGGAGAEGDGTVEVCGERVADDGSLPGPLKGIEPLERVEAEANQFSKDLQHHLRKGKVDFAASLRVLGELGIRVARGQGAGQKWGKKRGKPDEGGPEGGAEGGAEGTAAEGTAAEGTAAKRPRGEGEAAAGSGAAGDGTVRLFDVARAEEGNGGYREGAARAEERRRLDLSGKLYLAPLTTVGNLPYRRVCKRLGADVTIGEMALATQLLQGQASEWALLRRHPEEDLFGVQLCGGYADSLCKVAQLVEDTCEVDFVDVNMGCPIDLVCQRGGGSALLTRPDRIKEIVQSMSRVLSCPLTVKIRKGFHDNQDNAHRDIVPHLREWGAAAVTLHGRTRQQRYSRCADWEYIQRCARESSVPVVGNGDVYTWRDYHDNVGGEGQVATAMLARGALIKPWLFTEIKERRDWDISSGERLDLLRQYVRFGLEHWGSDGKGVETTRKFLLEWLSFLHRYVPVGLLDRVTPKMHLRPPAFYGRDHLETLMGSDNARDWVRISEMLLGPVPADFSFHPKHKTNSYVVRDGDYGAAMGGPAGGAGQGAIEEGEENG